MRRAETRWDDVTQRALPSARVTHLHLFRHGAVDTGGRRLAYGHSDLPLSPAGEQASDDLAAMARDLLPPIDSVLSSDLRRCADLAWRLGAALGVPVELDPALREQHMGAWEGRSWEELTAEDEPGVQAWWADYLRARPPGGETYAELAARVESWWQRSAPRLSGGRHIVVTHIGVIRALLCRALQVPLDQALRWAPPRGSHSHLLVGEAGCVLEALGEQPPLRAGKASAVRAPLPSPPIRRLALAGSAGTGKSTLGRALAAHLDLPYIPEGMRARLEAGLDLHSLGPDAFRGLLWELWEEQVAREEQAVVEAGGYVADRSPWDYAAFWLHYRFASDRQDTERFFAAVRARAAACQRILLLPWGVLPLQADGVRSTNPWLQRHFQACVEGLLAREVAPERVLQLPALVDLDARLAWVRQALSS